MATCSVELTVQEWQQVVAMIAQQPWHLANPLLTRISAQLQEAKTEAAAPASNDEVYPSKAN